MAISYNALIESLQPPGCLSNIISTLFNQIRCVRSLFNRVIEGVETLTLENAKAGKKYDDCVAIGGAWNGDHIGWQIPYRALLPKNVENIITAGRSLSAEPLMSDVVRVYPNCWASGHAAGVAAAVAAKSDVTARAVDISEVRRNLLAQKAYLG